MKNNIETRDFKSSLEIRQDESNGKLTITGLAIPFAKSSEDLGFFEFINERAFDESLNDLNHEILCLYSHDWSQPLARRSVGTLKLEKRSDGIYYTAEMPDTTRAQDLVKDIKAGNIYGNSFGFSVEDERWFVDENGNDCREILGGILYEVSPVVSPAYTDTKVASRSLSDFKKNNAKAKINQRAREIEILKLKQKQQQQRIKQ